MRAFTHQRLHSGMLISWLSDSSSTSLRGTNTRALIRKIEPPIKRASLSAQTKFWNTFLKKHPIYCIYSETLLQPSSFNLDHFLPPSFVCHDELWNLIPVGPRANSRKGRSLPNDKFIDPFIEQQVIGLGVHRNRSNKFWKKTVQPYVEGLTLTEEEVGTPEIVRHALSNKIKPLISLARTMGH